MKRFISMATAFVVAMSMLCTIVSATGTLEISHDEFDQNAIINIRATGSFNMSVAPYGKSEADKALPLDAGETVNISAVYSPKDSNLDFGLVDSNGVFHYFTVTDGNIDKTIQISESGNYTFAIRNNSDTAVKVSGFLRY